MVLQPHLHQSKVARVRKLVQNRVQLLRVGLLNSLYIAANVVYRATSWQLAGQIVLDIPRGNLSTDT